MAFIIISTLLCACIGTGFNYLGISLVIEAFNQIGGVTIGLYSLGILSTLYGWVCFILFALCGQILLKEIKKKLKGESK